MNIEEINGNSLSFIGDAYHSLIVRTQLIKLGYRKAKDLQKLSLRFVSAKSQMEIFNFLLENKKFKEEELEVYKKGRNAINHIPKNGNLKTYACASGFEAIVGYLYLSQPKRLDVLYQEIFKWRKIDD